eukprot:832791-Pyramimonas_sp.AAC.1
MQVSARQRQGSANNLDAMQSHERQCKAMQIHTKQRNSVQRNATQWQAAQKQHESTQRKAAGDAKRRSAEQDGAMQRL